VERDGGKEAELLDAKSGWTGSAQCKTGNAPSGLVAQGEMEVDNACSVWVEGGAESCITKDIGDGCLAELGGDQRAISGQVCGLEGLVRVAEERGWEVMALFLN
jgi:hypothetical protein